jgi:hypothetical protein
VLNPDLAEKIHLRPAKRHAQPEVKVFATAIAFVEQSGIDHRLPRRHHG